MEEYKREDWVRCPYCKLFFRGENASIVKIKRNKVKYFTCLRCGNDFAGGYYNKRRDENVHVASVSGISE